MYKNKKPSRITRPIKPMAAVGALLIAGAFAAPAQAQTNVTLYGRVVAGLNYQSNQAPAAGQTTGGSTWGVNGNEWGTSMWGVKGTEDLGGGLNALFDLESGFSANTGTVNGGTGLWTRRSYVGLSGGAGTLKLGKDLAIQSDPIWALDPTGQQAMSTATLVKERNWPQTNNMVSYETPDFGGFTATGMHGFGQQPGSFQAASRDGISLAYLHSAYELRAIYDLQRDINGGYSTLYNNSKEAVVGGTVIIDKLKLFAGFENLKAPNALAGAPSSANMYWLGANYNITPALQLLAAAYHTKVNQNVGAASLYMVGANYNLSKRTLLYVSMGTVRNNANSDFSVEYGDSGGVLGQNQNAFYTGISHSF